MTSTGRPRVIAHVKQDSEGRWIEHALDEHLRKVGGLVGTVAESFGNNDWAKLAGRWHNLGKYKADFQSYIRDEAGNE